MKTIKPHIIWNVLIIAIACGLLSYKLWFKEPNITVRIDGEEMSCGVVERYGFLWLKQKVVCVHVNPPL